MKATLKFFVMTAALRHTQKRYAYNSYKYKDDPSKQQEIQQYKDAKKHIEELLDAWIERSIDAMPKDDIETLDDPTLSAAFLDYIKYRQWRIDHPKQ